MENTECPAINGTETQALFHWETEVEDRTATCEEERSEAALKQSDPTSLVSFFVTLLKDFFSDPNNIEDDGIRDLVERKGIIISSLSDFNSDVAGTKPCIFVEYGGKKNQDAFAQHNAFGYNAHNGGTAYYTRWQMGFTFFALGKTINETQNLAEEVCNVFHYYQKPLTTAMRWLQCQVSEVQKAQSIENQGGFIAPVSFSVISHCSWYLFDSSPKLKRVILAVNHANSSLDMDE